jgi:GTP-binding protein LepA
VLVRIIDGVLKKGMKHPDDGQRRRRATGRPDRRLPPKQVEVDELGPGEIGFHHRPDQAGGRRRVGDTITDEKRQPSRPLPGFKPAQPVVFCGLFPVDAAELRRPARRHGRLRLNDASFTYEMEPPRRWALASAAAFWACCTWRSSRSAWSASSTST